MANAKSNIISGAQRMMAQKPQPQKQGLMGGMSLPTAPAQPSNPIASQTHTDAMGNSVKTTYAVPKDKEGNPSSPTSPMAIKMVNGLHHVPFIDKDGSTKYINAHGQIIQ